jgi:hypothetical protein
MTKIEQAPELSNVEALLPWHAAGTLSRREAVEVEQALAADPELARRYELVREELGETIRLNETLGAPSARAMERLFAAIDAEEAKAPRRQARFNFAGWVSETLSSLSPRTLAWSATAAAVAIALQAGLLASVYVGSERAYETASQRTAATSGSFALIGFAPQASAADITRFLETHKLVVVDGPRAGGLFRVRVAAADAPKDEAARVIARMREDTGIVRFASPTE